MPGVGKTFLARHLTRMLKGQGLQVSERGLSVAADSRFTRISAKLCLVIYGLLSERNSLGPVLALIGASGVASNRAKLKLVFNWLYLCALIRRESSQYPIVVMDQGLAQALWSTLFYGVERPQDDLFAQQFCSLLDALKLQSLQIIQVHAPEETIKSRIDGRKHGMSPLDGGNQDDWSKAEWATSVGRDLIDLLRSSDSVLQIADLSDHGDGIDEADLERICERVIATRPSARTVG